MGRDRQGSLISVRPDVKVVDCTLRDGGLVNNFAFTDEFVKDLYLANIKAGVDYMEFGYKASKEIFSPDKFGKWKFCDEKNIRAIVGDNKTDLKIAVMADVGRTDYKKDILNKKDSVIDLIRVATYINTIPTAIEMIEDAKKKGYETSANIMAVSKVNDEDLDGALEMLGQSSVDVIYLVDSFGSFYPEQIERISDKYLNVAAKYKKKIGIHAHNNQQLAFANTIEALSRGASFLDATVNGMGRGAGNCYMELLLSFLRNPKYNKLAIMNFVEKHMLKLKEESPAWGFDIPYLRTCARQYHLSIPFSEVESLDLFPIARRHKTLFQLPNCKQKSVERFFHLGREDAYSGGELIEQYEAYLATDNETLYQNLLLHNEEDVSNLPLLHACLNAYEFSIPEALHAEMVSSPVGISLVLTLPQTIPVPVQLETSCGTLLLQNRLCTLSFPFYAGELRLFYPNYKDYYYLPEEDYAIHQKVAQFVDKSHRKKATASTCYTRHSGYFLPLPGAVTEPVFQMTPKKGPWYVLYAKELVAPDELSEKEYSRVRDALLSAADILLSDCNLTVKK